MAALFDLVKNPELAERVPDQDLDLSDDDAPAAGPDSAYSVEVQRLRRRALEVDAHALALRTITCHTPLDELAQEFLRKCLEAGAAASDTVQHDLPDFSDRRYQIILRVCTVPLVTGNWATVADGRESAIAAAAELHERGYAAPAHRFDRNGSEWTLSIRFGF